MCHEHKCHELMESSLYVTNSTSHLNTTNSMSHLNITNSTSDLYVTNANVTNSTPMETRGCAAETLLSHLYVTNSASRLNTTNTRSRRNITNSTSHLHVTNVNDCHHHARRRSDLKYLDLQIGRFSRPLF